MTNCFLKFILYLLVTIYGIQEVIAMDTQINIPHVKKIPQNYEIHNDKNIDNYAWLRDKNWPEIIDEEILSYLRQENKYTDAIMAPNQKNIDIIFQELRGRIKEDDASYPVKIDDYLYYTRMEHNKNYAIHCRKKSGSEKEEILLDENKLAEGKSYFSLGDFSVSYDHTKIAYSIDEDGSEHYKVIVVDIATGKIIDSVVSDVMGSLVWDASGNGFFYTRLNDKWRRDQAKYHKLGTNSDSDLLLYKEDDITFRVNVGLSSDKRYLLIDVHSSNSNEVRYVDLYEDKYHTKLITTRKPDRLSYVDHINDIFYIKTNDKGKNFRLAVADIATIVDENNWREVIPHNDKVYLTDLALYKHYVALNLKENGLPTLVIYDHDFKNHKKVNFPDEAYSAEIQFTTIDDPYLRIEYSSLNTPRTIIEYDMTAGISYTRKVQQIPSGYSSQDYETKRLYVRSRDGVQVPISLVYKKSMLNEGANPLYLYGYGSYGIAMKPHFRSNIISLLDRGFIYAIAHIRGGDDLGYDWYESAKFLNKKHTFNDFIDCAEHLIKAGYTTKGNIVIHGGSAGGMLMGVVLNERPELFKAAIADVPFVDVLNTMLDDNLPLTPGEFKEWGNPKQKEYYDYIKSYSPYDNIKKQSYPAILVTAGLNDPRVTYWEPAKWVAKLREYKTDSNILLLKTNMDAGHAGESGRFNYLKEIAFMYGFVLMIYGMD
jgi:oligopeptidase B